MIKMLLALSLLFPVSAFASWIHVPSSIQTIQLGLWNSSTNVYSNFRLTGLNNNYYITSSTTPSALPLSSAVPFPALSPSMLLAANATPTPTSNTSTSSLYTVDWHNVGVLLSICLAVFGLSYGLGLIIKMVSHG